jgi:hypothetical protein
MPNKVLSHKKIQRQNPSKRKTERVSKDPLAGKSSSRVAGVRTPSSVISTLSQRPHAVPNGLPPYVVCRLNPFEGKGKVGIPDGGNSNFIVVDTVAIDNLSFSGVSNFLIQTLPTLPFASVLMNYSGNVITVNGNAFSSGVYPPLATTVNSMSYPLGYISQYNTATFQPQVGLAAPDPFSGVNARIVQIAYRIRYTGPVNTCSGNITVTSNDVSLQQEALLTTNTTATGNLVSGQSALNSQVTSTNYFTAGTPVLGVGCSTNPNIMNRTSVSFRPEEGVFLTLKHKTNDFKVRDLFGVGPMLAFNSKMAPATANYHGIPSGNYCQGTNTATINFFDNDWQSYQIVFTGINSDASFRMETIYCLEFSPSAGTLASTLSSPKSADIPASIKMANDMLGMMPTASPAIGRPHNPGPFSSYD